MLNGFKGHPKGLFAAALANMGERFGFYTMMAILVLFLQTKFSLDEENAGLIYSTFYFLIYMLALVGGIVADKLKNYKGTIFVGITMMAGGYALLSIPSQTPVPDASYTTMLILTCAALFVIAFGNGLFKGNLQALVGQMYDNDQFKAKRDEGFSIFYMFINVGAIFAPILAVIIRNGWVNYNGFQYDQTLPDVCNQFLSEVATSGVPSIRVAERLSELAHSVGYTGSDLTTFAHDYLGIFTTGFHYAFGAAIIAMLISLVIYALNMKKFPNPKSKDNVVTTEDSVADKMTALKGDIDATLASGKEVASETWIKYTATKYEFDKLMKDFKGRIFALLAVFAVVIFFWFSFHQNGLTMTYFAKDYTAPMQLDLGFQVLEGAELFQSFNPLFVVLLTFIVVPFFGWLRSRGIEPSTPRKIAIGMGIAALGFVVMALGSWGLPLKNDIVEVGYTPNVTPWLLIGSYFVLTIAELFISPMGISFVSKVAPAKYQGLMQGLWLGATALGNQLLVFGAIFYQSWSMTATWTVFVVACCISMFTMLFMVKWLERVTK